MQLFYAPDMTAPLHTLSEDESKHCVRVLRLKEGDLVHITDGRGTLYRCRLIQAHPKRCQVQVEECFEHFEQLPYRLIMAVAPTKNNDRFEWFLEKATEVGISEIYPLESEHSERRVFKAERGEKVITAAMKQSLKAYHPELHPVTPFDTLINLDFEGRKFIAHCDTPQTKDGKKYLAHTLQKGEDALILIGPEGDFSPSEIARAVRNGFEEITLGKQRLRTETAAVVATVFTSVVNH